MGTQGVICVTARRDRQDDHDQRMRAGPEKINPVAAQWRALGAQPGQRLLLQASRGPPVGPDHPPPRHTCPVPGHHLSHLARAATADQLGEVGIGAGPAGWNGLDSVQHRLDVVVHTRTSRPGR